MNKKIKKMFFFLGGEAVGGAEELGILFLAFMSPGIDTVSVQRLGHGGAPLDKLP